MIRKAPIFVLAFVLLVSLAPAHAQQNESYMFQTVLLYGSAEGKSDLGDVPQNVLAALDDVKKFLPYKSYRLVDASILRSNHSAGGRLTGPEGKEFELEFSFRPGEDDTLLVKSFGIDTFVIKPRDRVIIEGNEPKIVHEPPRRARKSVIASSFTVKIGETIVVGTSKLNGSGTALVVLFTAMR